MTDMLPIYNGHSSTPLLYTANSPLSPAQKSSSIWNDWENLDPFPQMQRIMEDLPADLWTEMPYLEVIAQLYAPLSAVWLNILDRYVELGGHTAVLVSAVQAYHHALEREQKSCKSGLHTMSAIDLFQKPIPPVRSVIPGKLPVGATLFCGRGKDGKSLLVWDLCMAVASGGKALGAYEVEPGDVLYCALEDSERRAQKRLREQMEHHGLTEPPERLEFVLWHAPRIGEGFIEGLHAWLDVHPNARLVVIDILEKIRPPRTRNGVYSDDYRALEDLQQLAQQRDIAVLVVHHSNKTRPEDFRDTANGSNGLVGACDTFWSLHRVAGEADAALRMIGRDIEQQDIALHFEAGFWSVLGDVTTVAMHKERVEILRAIETSGKAMTPKAVAEVLEKNLSTTRNLLYKLVEAKLVWSPVDGHYCVTDAGRKIVVSRSTSSNPDVDSIVPVVPVVPVVSVVPTEKPPVELRWNYGGTTADTPPQTIENSGGNGVRNYETTGTTVPMSLSEGIPPCAQCGGTERYVDGKVYRCQQCWPPRV